MRQADDFPGEPLTVEETRKLRRLLRDQERMEWLWASARIWAGWLAAAVVFALGVVETVKRLGK